MVLDLMCTRPRACDLNFQFSFLQGVKADRKSLGRWVGTYLIVGMYHHRVIVRCGRGGC